MRYLHGLCCHGTELNRSLNRLGMFKPWLVCKTCFSDRLTGQPMFMAVQANDMGHIWPTPFTDLVSKTLAYHYHHLHFLLDLLFFLSSLFSLRLIFIVLVFLYFPSVSYSFSVVFTSSPFSFYSPSPSLPPFSSPLLFFFLPFVSIFYIILFAIFHPSILAHFPSPPQFRSSSWTKFKTSSDVAAIPMYVVHLFLFLFLLK